MSFLKKTWLDRITEFPARRTLTKSNSETEVVNVARNEGEILQEGDAFSAENMNDLEDRIANEFTQINSDLTELKYNDIGTRVDITSYTTSNLYTCPSDGYVDLVNGTASNSGVSIRIYKQDGTPSHITASALGAYAITNVYVRKGMKVAVTSVSAGGAVLFIPFED